MTAATPDLEGFRELARSRRVIPVVRRLLADGDTPVGLYRKLAGERPGTFLLESAEHGRVWSRYSFIGVQAAAMLSEVDGQATWRGRAPVGRAHHGQPAGGHARHPGPAAHRRAGGRRPAAPDRRPRRDDRLRRSPALGAAAGRQPRRARPARGRDAAGHRPRRAGPLGRHGAADRQRGQLRRHRRAGRRGLGRCRGPPRRDGAGAGSAQPRVRRCRWIGSPPRRRCSRARVPRTTWPGWRQPRSTSGPAMPSRSCCPSASTVRRRPAPWTSTGCCG